MTRYYTQAGLGRELNRLEKESSIMKAMTKMDNDTLHELWVMASEWADQEFACEACKGEGYFPSKPEGGYSYEIPCDDCDGSGVYLK